MANQPRSELARYAYGYSDKKPGLSYWLILAGMVVFIAYNLGPDMIRIEYPEPVTATSE